MDSKAFRLLTHEVFFQAFLIITWVRLVWSSGFMNFAALAYLGAVLLAVALIVLSAWTKGQLGWRLRLFYYPLAMNVAYMRMAPVVEKIHRGPLYDALLRSIDARLIGQNLSLRLDSVSRVLFTEPLSFCYMLFVPYLTLSMLSYFCGPLDRKSVV